MTWSADVVQDTLHTELGDTNCLVGMFKSTVLLRKIMWT